MGKIIIDINSSLDRTYEARMSGNDKLPCIICNELFELTDQELRYVLSGGLMIKACDKCKQAVMKMRETIEHEDKKEKQNEIKNKD